MTKKRGVLNELMLHEKPVRILVALRVKENNYASRLMKAADCTYSHTVKILDSFKKAGLIIFEKKGRVKHIKLTHLGKDVASDLECVLKKLSKVKIDRKSEKKK